MSPGLELNDVGYLRQADAVLNTAKLEFLETVPKGHFRSYGFNVTREDGWDFGGMKTAGATGFEANGNFKNLWGVSGELNVVEAPTDTRLLRGGPSMTTTGFVSAGAGVHSDRSRRISVALATERHFVMDGDGKKSAVTTTINVRPINAFNFSVLAFYERNVDNLQYVNIWSQDRTNEEVFGKSLTSSLDQLRMAPAANVFLVKLSYWFGL